MKRFVSEDAVLIPKEAECVFEGVIFDVYQWQQERFDGSYSTFEMLKRADTVEIIAIVDDKIVVLDDEQPIRGVMASLPGGRVEQGEDILTAAKRELKEETGITINEWKLAFATQSYRKIEWFNYTFIAYGGYSIVEPNTDPGEKITVSYESFESFKKRCQSYDGFLGYLLPHLENIENIDQLESMPEFKGKEVS